MSRNDVMVNLKLVKGWGVKAYVFTPSGVLRAGIERTVALL